MSFKILHLFVEGIEDKRFFEKIIASRLSGHYDHLNIIEYARLPNDKIRAWVNSISCAGGDYIFACDLDFCPCSSIRKVKIIEKYPFLNVKNICIVKSEIESWYLAGVSKIDCTELGISKFADTETVTKEQFNQIIPPKLMPKSNFLAKILHKYSCEEAIQFNKSFNYFFGKYCLNE